jgi:hypothetical protein
MIPSPYVTKRMCDLIGRGNTIKIACAFANISRSTFMRWMQAGEKDPHGPYGEFYKSICLAEAQCESKLVSRVWNASKKNGMLAAQMLKTRFPDGWSDKQKIQIEGNIEVDHRVTQEFDTRLANLVAAGTESLGTVEVEVKSLPSGDACPDPLLAPVGETQSVTTQ